MKVGKILIGSFVCESYPGCRAVGNSHLLDDSQVSWGRGCHFVVSWSQKAPIVSIFGYKIQISSLIHVSKQQTEQLTDPHNTQSTCYYHCNMMSRCKKKNLLLKRVQYQVCPPDDTTTPYHYICHITLPVNGAVVMECELGCQDCVN